MAQYLTPTAKRMKAIRDLKAAKTKKRKDRKAENQRIGQRSDSDIHHKSDGSTERVSVKDNRGNFCNGTKKESPIELLIPRPSLCTDNGAMIASAAYFRLKNNLFIQNVKFVLYFINLIINQFIKIIQTIF